MSNGFAAVGLPMVRDALIGGGLAHGDFQADAAGHRVRVRLDRPGLAEQTLRILFADATLRVSMAGLLGQATELLVERVADAKTVRPRSNRLLTALRKRLPDGGESAALVGWLAGDDAAVARVPRDVREAIEAIEEEQGPDSAAA